ncbi:MAG: hypothetical protein LUF34_12405, partial [Lachnospiraceae bacterium]|nr:hypothetical protein [Lachnospiraceae bacterium]
PPARLPIHKRMHMKPTTLLTICVLAMGVLNLMPWAGPTMRSASVLGIEANVLWRELLPIQAVGIVLAFVVAFILGKKEEKAGAGLHGRLAQEKRAKWSLTRRSRRKPMSWRGRSCSPSMWC